MSVTVAAVAVFALAFAPALVAHAEPVTVERVVAIVNAEVVLQSELADKAQQITGQQPDEAAPEGKKRLRQVLERMVDDLLVLQQATDLKLAVEEAEIDRAIDEVKKSNNLDGDGFKQALADQGYSVTSFRRDMRRQILRLKVINTAVRSRVNVSDEDVKAFYEQNARQAGGHRMAHVRHVLIAVPAGASESAVEQRRRIAMQVMAEARGGADFAALVKKHSDDAATRNEGGDLGWLQEGEGLNEALSAVVFSMDTPNEVRGPVLTNRGFEVLQLVERKDGDVRPLAEVKEQIRNQMYQQQLERQTATWIAELHKKAHIEMR